MAATRTTTKTTPTTSYPLTTLFEPSSSCFGEHWFPTVFPNFDPTVVFVNGPPIGVETANLDCWPEDHRTVSLSTTTFYSPGICPSGYSTAAQSYVSETMYAYCCIDGYTLLPEQGPLNVVGSTVRSSDFTRDLYDSAICKSALETAIAVPYESADGEIHTTDLRKGHSVIHFPIRVKYQMTDFSKFPTDAQPTDLPTEALQDLEPFIRSGLITIVSQTGARTSSTKVAKTSSGTDSNETNSIDPPADANESKTGTIAIAVGVTVSVVIVLAVIGFIIFSWRRKKRRQAQSGESFPTASGPYRQHTNNDSQVGGIQDYPDQTGGIALEEPGQWPKYHQ